MNAIFRSFLCAACLLALAAEVRADQKPVGYLIPVPTADGNDTEEIATLPAGSAFRERDGQKIDAQPGLEILDGDVISTVAGGTVGIAFLDGSAVTLRESTQVKVVSYAYPEKRAPTYVSVERGKAFFSVNPRPADSHFFVQSELGVVEVKGTKFEVFASQENGVYTTQVAVTSGVVTVLPSGSEFVTLNSGAKVVLTLHTTNINAYKGAKFNGAQMDIQSGKLTALELKSLRANAITDISVTVKSNGTVSIVSTALNPDGTRTTVTMTKSHNGTTKTTTIVKDQNKKQISKIVETFMTDTHALTKANITQTLNGVKLTANLKANGSGTAVIKVGTISYKGTFTRLANGTEISDCQNKQGERYVVVVQQLADGSISVTTTTFGIGAQQGAQTTVITKLDGSKITQSLTVSAVKLPDGTFTPLQPPTVETSPALRPPPPGVLSGKIVVIPDPNPVSP